MKCEEDASLTRSVPKANLRSLLLNLLCVKIESANSHAIEKLNLGPWILFSLVEEDVGGTS